MLHAIALTLIVAAPALKSDSIVGELRLNSGKDPVVIVNERQPEGDFKEVTYWLVFVSDASEKAVVDLGQGFTVRAHGKISRGGQYHYVIVEKVTKE